MIDQADILSIVQRISYLDWTFRVGVESGAAWLQVIFPDRQTGEIQHGRKWRVSFASTPGEIVQTALAAILAAEEHEAREKFLFDGKPIFHPHHQLEDLIACADRTEVRKAAAKKSFVAKAILFGMLSLVGNAIGWSCTAPANAAPPTPAEIATRMIAGDLRADYDGDGVTDGRDLAAATTMRSQPWIGIYSPRAIANVWRHPRREELRDANRGWLRAWGDASHSGMALIDKARRAAEFEYLSDDRAWHDKLMEWCGTIAAQWPGGLSSHELTSAMPRQQINELCAIASLVPDTLPILRPALERSLADIQDGRLIGTGPGKALWCRVNLCRVLGINVSPFADNGRDRGLAVLLAGVEPSGWPQWYVGSPWYIGMNAVPAMAAIGWDLRDEMTHPQHERFMALMALPWRFSVHGATPIIGEDFTEKRQKAYKVFCWDWAAPGLDDGSAWVRGQGGALRFETLTIPSSTTATLPSAAKGTRHFDGRASIFEGPSGWHIVVYWSNQPDARKSNLGGSHTYDGPTPQITIVKPDGSQTFLRPE